MHERSWLDNAAFVKRQKGTDMDELTTTQFGDACEHIIMGELMLAGHDAVKMPDGWKGYDIFLPGRNERVSVRGRRHGGGGDFWNLTSNGHANYDWIALLNIKPGERCVYILPRDAALAIGRLPSKSDGNRGLRVNHPALLPWKNNFALRSDIGGDNDGLDHLH
jgi:hypothetical protein